MPPPEEVLMVPPPLVLALLPPLKEPAPGWKKSLPQRTGQISAICYIGAIMNHRLLQQAGRLEMIHADAESLIWDSRALSPSDPIRAAERYYAGSKISCKRYCSGCAHQSSRRCPARAGRRSTGGLAP